jgi:hypothetical protein
MIIFNKDGSATFVSDTNVSVTQSASGTPAQIDTAYSTFLQANPPPVSPLISVPVTSASTPAINGTYAVDPDSQQKIAATSLYIQVNNRFPASQTALQWPDVNGVPHGFTTTALYQEFATAIADFVAAFDLGLEPVPPIQLS